MYSDFIIYLVFGVSEYVIITIDITKEQFINLLNVWNKISISSLLK